MKKKIFINVLALILIVSLVFLFYNNYSESQKHKQSKNKEFTYVNDYRITANRLVDPGEYKNIQRVNSVNDYYISDNLSDMQEKADEIVEGEIIAVEHLAISGDAWTKVDVKITGGVKGKLKSGDKISVYQSGGYVPLTEHIKAYDDAFRYSHLSEEEIENTVIYDVVDDEETPKVGTTAIFMLAESSSDIIPRGAYQRVRGKYAQLNNLKGSTYRCYNDTADKGYVDKSFEDIKRVID